MFDFLFKYVVGARFSKLKLKTFFKDFKNPKSKSFDLKALAIYRKTPSKSYLLTWNCIKRLRNSDENIRLGP